jgi:hypothetical protein
MVTTKVKSLASSASGFSCTKNLKENQRDSTLIKKNTFLRIKLETVPRLNFSNSGGKSRLQLDQSESNLQFYILK